MLLCCVYTFHYITKSDSAGRHAAARKDSLKNFALVKRVKTLLFLFINIQNLNYCVLFFVSTTGSQPIGRGPLVGRRKFLVGLQTFLILVKIPIYAQITNKNSIKYITSEL
jgi:hypothetical protein